MLGEANVVRRIAQGMRGSWRLSALAAALLGLFAAATAHAASNDDRVFVVGNYPVDATAENAVAAKSRAISEGQQRAFRSLLKRLIPVTDYKQLDALKGIDARQYVTSVGVRSEERSSTRYIASLDFGFSPDAVRNLLRDRSVPFLERQAPETTVVLVYEAPNGGSTPRGPIPRGMGQAEGSRLWTSVWRDLDLKNALAPIKVAQRLPQIQGDAIATLAKGDMTALGIFAQEYATPRVVMVLAAPDPANKRIRFVLSGQDATGAFHLDRSYRIFDGDMAYTLELAAVVAQGILESRWKAINVRTVAGGSAAAGGLEPVQIWVTYQGFPQWQSMRQILEETPGVADLTVGGQSARGASVGLRFPGGGAGLAAALAPRGLTLEQQNGTWVLR